MNDTTEEDGAGAVEDATANGAVESDASEKDGTAVNDAARRFGAASKEGAAVEDGAAGEDAEDKEDEDSDTAAKEGAAETKGHTAAAAVATAASDVSFDIDDDAVKVRVAKRIKLITLDVTPIFGGDDRLWSLFEVDPVRDLAVFGPNIRSLGPIFLFQGHSNFGRLGALNL